MKKCIVVDIDGTLADSEAWQKKYFCSGYHDEEGYMKEIFEFPVAKWLETLIDLYWNNYYNIFILSSRHESFRKETMRWLTSKTNLMSKNKKMINKIILKSDIKQDQADYKLNEIKKIACYNDIEIIFDDNPKVVKLLQDNGFNGVLVKTLY